MRLTALFRRVPKPTTFTSRQQFEADFGEFPPHPLVTNASVERPFTVIHLGQCGRHLLDIKKVFTIIWYYFKPPKDNYTELVISYIKNSQDFEAAKSSFRDVEKKYRSLSFHKKALFTVILACLTPLLATWIFYMTFRMLRRSLRSNTEFQKIGGFHSPLPGQRDKVYVNAVRNPKSGFGTDHIITHEHIHLVQNAFLLSYVGPQSLSKTFRDPVWLKDEKYRAKDSYIDYLFEKHEIEARLHEVVLSAYRARKKMPLTLDDFVEAIAANHECAFFMQVPEDTMTKKQLFDSLYHSRSSPFGDQLSSVLFVLKDSYTATQFVTEVFAVMYSNLLHYYGDEEASRHFGKQIPRPNLYDRIYG